MGDFEIARRVLGALAAIGWGVIAISIFVLIIYYFSSPNEFSVIITFIACGLIAVFGFIIIAVAQMGLVQIVTAENTREMLQIMQAQQGSAEKEVITSKIMLDTNPDSNSKVKSVGSLFTTYKNYEITRTVDGVSVEGQLFPDVFAAEKWIRHNSKF